MVSRSRKIVIDSDVLIEVLRGNERFARELRICLESGNEVAVTPVTIAEILAGARVPELSKTRALLDSLVCLRIDRAVGEIAGRYVARFARSHAVEVADALVAACAKVHRYRLWTHSRKHYPMRDIRLFTPPNPSIRKSTERT